MIFGTRKVECLGYRMVKKIAEKFNRLSRVHQRHRQTTDDRQQTDGRPIAYSERNVVRSLKTTLIDLGAGRVNLQNNVLDWGYNPPGKR